MFEQAQGDEGIDFRPDPLLFEKSQATERRPTTGLTPHGDTGHIGGFAQFNCQLLIVAPDEARVFTATFVFPPRLQFDNLRQISDEKISVQRQVSEKI